MISLHGLVQNKEGCFRLASYGLGSSCQFKFCPLSPYTFRVAATGLLTTRKYMRFEGK